MRRATRDIISLDPGKTTTKIDADGVYKVVGNDFPTFDGFIHYILSNSVDPRIYDESLFSRYLMPNILWSQDALTSYFRSEYTELTQADVESAITHKFNVSDLLTDDEKIITFENMFGGAIKETATIILSIPTRRSLTAGQVIQLLIRAVLYTLRQQTKSFEEHAKIFADKKYLYPIIADLHSKRRKHMEFCSLLVHRFISKFVATIKQQKKTLASDDLIDSRFVLLYCDIIEGQIVGEGRHRLLWQQPYVAGISSMYLHETANPVFYCKVEKSKFKTIRFRLTNEQGQKINFVDSYSPNFVCLSFKHSQKNLEGEALI